MPEYGYIKNHFKAYGKNYYRTGYGERLYINAEQSQYAVSKKIDDNKQCPRDG